VRSTDVLHASDEALVAGMAAGDTEAARALVGRYQGRVFGLALTILRDRPAAEDVAQETFVRAWRHAAVFDPRRAAVAPWLLTITRNAAIDAARLRRPTALDPHDPEVLALIAQGRGPADEAVANTEVQRVRVALEGLPDEQRRAVVLATLLGRTASEIAEHEQIPLGTAKTRVRAGLRRLRDRLVDVEAP